MQLVHTQASQLAEAHVHDCLRLKLVQIKAALQVALGVNRRLRVAYDVHHLVNIVHRNDQSLQDVGALLGLAQVEARAADGHVVAVLHKVFHALLQAQQARATFHQRNVVHRERALQCRHLKQLVENHVGVGVFLHVDHDAHALPSRLVVGVGDALQLPLLHQVGNILNELSLVHPVGNLGHHNLVVGLVALNLGLGAHHDASASRLVGVSHALYAIDIGARGEVGSLDIAHQSVGVDVGVVDIGAAAVNHLAQVVRRHIGSHTHGNTVTTVHQQVGHLGRHDARLRQRVVEVVHHVDGVLLQVVHDVLAHLRQAALSVTHGSGRVAVHAAEVALSVHQCVAHVPVLCHAHQCAVDARVAVRVILTQHLAHHASTFLIRFVARVADARHAIQYTAVHGFKSVAHVGQRSGYYHRHRIVDVGGFHFLLDINFNDSVVVDGLTAIEGLIFVHLSCYTLVD